MFYKVLELKNICEIAGAEAPAMEYNRNSAMSAMSPTLLHIYRFSRLSINCRNVFELNFFVPNMH